jgi:hypothetical protein
MLKYVPHTTLTLKTNGSYICVVKLYEKHALCTHMRRLQTLLKYSGVSI